MTTTILMAIYHGGDHLRAQLDSFAAQSVPWDLQIGDDGGDPRDADIIRDFARSAAGRGRRISHVAGPGRGFAANFMHLIATQQDATGPVALSDQDDIWLPGKLARALAHLDRIPADQPALYCSRRWNWDPRSGRRAVSRRFDRAPDFANALIENVAPGNTIVLNAAAARLAARAAQKCGPVFAHDWWLYQMLSGAGAHIIVDPEPTLLYRQHDGNALGAGEGLAARLRNKRDVLRGRYARRLALQLAALDRCAALLTPDNRNLLARLARSRQATLPERIGQLCETGVYRQSTMSSLGFWGAAILGRI
ncbi:glycosyltransferase [Actibacterium ureilyticum]|uniref:glycosyltransferase n=1 Tax=Actibacterium ureilyticum TaxID=1590614 RepID=UPI0015954B61|nr:glycosyltransferase [Actibacterium ureilyticum]